MLVVFLSMLSSASLSVSLMLISMFIVESAFPMHKGVIFDIISPILTVSRIEPSMMKADWTPVGFRLVGVLSTGNSEHLGHLTNTFTDIQVTTWHPLVKAGCTCTSLVI